MRRSRWATWLSGCAMILIAVTAWAAPAGDSRPGHSPDGPYEHETIRRSGGSGTNGSAAVAGGSPRPTSAGNSGAWDITRVLLGLGAVLLLFLAMIALGRKVAPNAIGPKSNGAVRVLVKSSVAPRQQLMLVQVGRRIVLVGSGGGEMNALCQIDDPDEVAALLGRIDEDKASSPRSFMALFGKATAKYEPGSADPDAAALKQGSDEDLGGLTERVRGITRHFQK